jgi:ribosome-associated toxin RatA of RatAB toxin-antitoxin module
MHTVDEIVAKAPVQVCFEAGADVEGWPDALPHYRWVRFTRKEDFGTGRVEMAARRDFGPLGYPVWWVSEMSVDRSRPAVLYRHVQGITTGMEVVWSFSALDPERTRIRIVHSWDCGPAWPLPGRLRSAIANRVIGPIFIHHVASRTLAGIRDKAERLHAGRAQTAT